MGVTAVVGAQWGDEGKGKIIDELAAQETGHRVPMLTGLGATETAPCALTRIWDTENAANVGLPPPGMAVKRVPREGKLEARLSGPNITPGYWRQPELTAAAFDEDGFYRLGDAMKFDDPNDPAKGLGGHLPESIFTAFGDGSGHHLPASIQREVLSALFTRNGREPLSVGADGWQLK